MLTLKNLSYIVKNLNNRQWLAIVCYCFVL
jgi:hypothetical protein